MCGFHAPGSLGRDRPDGRLPARLRARQRGARAGARLGARAGPRRLGPAHPAGPAAQPRRARGPADRRAAGPARQLARRDRHRLARRRGRLRGAVLDAHRRPRREHPGRRDEADQGLRAAARGARRPRVPDLARRVLPDQHGDGRGRSTARRSSSPTCAATSWSSTSSAGSARSAWSWPAAHARSSASRSSSEAMADAIDNARRNEITNARFFAGDIRLAMRDLVEEAGKPDVVVIDPPRAGLSQKVVRRIVEAGAEADRLRLLQPDDARAERRAARRGRLRAPARAAGRHVPADAAHRVRRAVRGRPGRRRQPRPLAMRILVTGSAGHLGEALVRVLRDAGEDVRGADLLPSPYTDVVGSIADRDVARRAVAGVDAVLHAATLHKPHVGSHARRDFVDANITATRQPARGGGRGRRRALRVHQHDERVRPRARAAAGRAGRVDHRGRRAGPAQRLRRHQDRRRGPVRARAPRPRPAGGDPAHVALLPRGGRPRRRARRVRRRQPQGERAAQPARRPRGRRRRPPLRARPRAARSASAASS